MSYGGKGVWMPKQKDGLNWKLTYTILVVESGAEITKTYKSRVREGCTDKIRHIKNVIASGVEANKNGGSITNVKLLSQTIEKI